MFKTWNIRGFNRLKIEYPTDGPLEGSVDRTLEDSTYGKLDD